MVMREVLTTGAPLKLQLTPSEVVAEPTHVRKAVCSLSEIEALDIATTSTPTIKIKEDKVVDQFKLNMLWHPNVPLAPTNQ
jgi:hypothetical protein